MKLDTSFEILKIIIKEEHSFFVYLVTSGLSFIILLGISFVLFKSMKQADIYRKRHEKIMRESLKAIPK